MSIIKTKSYQVFIDESTEILVDKLRSLQASAYFVLVDENTKEHCLPILNSVLSEFDLKSIEIESGEENKTISTCQYIWEELSKQGADRKSVLLNLGGGVIGDMGGFAASCFMRGIRFVHIPTTLLSQVDASVGSKLGIDFNGIKNLVGVFNDPEFVFIHSPFLKTLPSQQIRSGFAETIKHALISDSDLWHDIQTFDTIENHKDWSGNIERSVSIKNEIVNQDPYESGLRKILNFGHTIGHAIESSCLNSRDPLLHGEAIALGMLVESYISLKANMLDAESFEQIDQFLRSKYSNLFQKTYRVQDILDYLSFDKKKVGKNVLFALIDQIGHCQFDLMVNNEQIEDAIQNTLKTSHD